MSTDILIIDDEPQLRQMLYRLLISEGYKVKQAENLRTGTSMLAQESFSLVLLDVKLPDGNGVDYTSVIKSEYPQTQVILLTAFGTIQDGVKAIKNGALDYLVKGDDNNKIIPLVSKALEIASIQIQKQGSTKFNTNPSGFESIIGESENIQKTIELARKVAPTQASVLLSGETGVGKEVFAQAIHHASPRAKHTLVALNCSAFSKDILESELFGHKAGAFTGANKDKKGFVEEANDGTLFLDEIGEMPMELQSKLLRFLETGEYYRLGDAKVQQANIRLICATNRDLLQEIEIGNFRRDLFYRISTFEINIPSLNERKEDIPLLVNYFSRILSEKLQISITQINKDFIDKLKQFTWKGNIRELRNVIERACILANNATLSIDTLPGEIQFTNLTQNTNSTSFDLKSIEKEHIQKVLAFCNGNKTKTAELLGIGLTTLYAKIKEYEI